MKITKESLQDVIEEELQKALKEQMSGEERFQRQAAARSQAQRGKEARLAKSEPSWLSTDFEALAKAAEKKKKAPTKVAKKAPAGRKRNINTQLHQAKLNLALAGAIKAGKKVTRPVIAIDGVAGGQTRQAVADLRKLESKRTKLKDTISKYAAMVTGDKPLGRAAAGLVIDEEFKTNPSLAALDKALKDMVAPAQQAVAKTGAAQPGPGVPISPIREGNWYDIKVKGPKRVKKMPNIPGQPGGPWDKSVATMEEDDKMHRDPSDEDCEDWVDLIAIAAALKMSKRAIEALRKEAAEGGCREVLDEDTLGFNQSAEASESASETAGGVVGSLAPATGSVYQVQADSDK